MSAQNGFPSKRKERKPQVIAASAVVRGCDGVLELDDLLRSGIAEAQCASLADNRREREKHLGISRELLITALKRHGSHDPDLRGRLLAVLSKLRQDPHSVMDLISETREQSSSVTSLRDSQDQRRRPAELENTGDEFDSEYSSEAADLEDVQFDFSSMPEDDLDSPLLCPPGAEPFHDSFGNIAPTASHKTIRALAESEKPTSASAGNLIKRDDLTIGEVSGRPARSVEPVKGWVSATTTNPGSPVILPKVQSENRVLERRKSTGFLGQHSRSFNSLRRVKSSMSSPVHSSKLDGEESLIGAWISVSA